MLLFLSSSYPQYAALSLNGIQSVYNARKQMRQLRKVKNGMYTLEDYLRFNMFVLVTSIGL